MAKKKQAEVTEAKIVEPKPEEMTLPEPIPEQSTALVGYERQGTVVVHALTDAEVLEKARSLGFVVIADADFAKLFTGLMIGNVMDWRRDAAKKKLGEMLGAKSPAECDELWQKFYAIDQKRVQG